MSNKNSNQDFLFSDFKTVSAKEWKLLIQAELKGADYNQTLVWESLEGIKVKPFYHADEMEYIKIPITPSDFEIAQSIYIDNETIANKIALEALENGVETILFIAENGFDADVLLQNFEHKKVKRIVIQLHYLAPHFIQNLKISFPNLPLELQIDPIGSLLSTGNWFINEKQDLYQIGEVLKEQINENILYVDSTTLQNAGANIIQQVAYTLAHANEYLYLFGKDKPNKISFGFAIGSNYFFEIAKLRAFRYLWQQLTATYQLKIEPIIFSKPSLRNKSIYDFNVNILRTATENMSAVLGGANVVSSLPYDAFFNKSNTFSERIARNQLLLLKAENEFIDAQYFATGSYYIEYLTLEIAKKALILFKEIEKSGGFLHQLKEGTIQKKIKESAEKEQNLFDKGRLVLLGTNKYINPQEQMKTQLTLFPFLKKKREKTDVVPIIERRLAEKIEQERLETEQ